MRIVEAIFHLPYLLTASGNLFLNMSDACETANCSFMGITHVNFRKDLAATTGDE